MKRSILFIATLVAAVAAMAASPRAQQAATAGGATSAGSDPTIDPDAMAALNKMGAYLRTLNSFQVHTEVTTEEVLVDGQKVTFASVIDLLAARPDRLRIEMNGDRRERMYLYDGTSFTLWARRLNYYATVPAPATIRELSERLQSKYDIDVPLADLFRWGTPDSTTDQIKAADDIGPSEIGGTTCEHYTFRQDGLDWQIWIQSGDFPLPRKLVLTTTTDDARPQHVSIYTWNLAPSFNDAAFKFDPPPDAHKIVLAEAGANDGKQ